MLLDDAFNPGYWKTGSYTPANETKPVADAMAIEVGCETKAREPQYIEYRFSQVHGKLTVSVAQDINSKNSDHHLEFSLVANGRQVQATTINFTEKKDLPIDLAGVTVLKIGVRESPGSKKCPDSTATALITRILLEQ